VEDRTVIQLGSPASVKRGVRLNGVYEVETLIAQGGMGEVYKGFNIQTSDPVAIKMILPELARNPEAFALFRREASTLHNLQHEAIVRYFVFSVDPDLQRAYLAMEFVDGPSLKKRLTQGPLSVAEATILRKRIAEGLATAHRFGVIHRDISSDNIILPGNDPRRAKIIDFGIARSQRPGEGTLIGDGFAGKFNYVSPEQLGLASGEVTAKSDVYSFGLVLAEALRGRPIDMNGTQVEVIEKRRSVPDLADIPAAIAPLLRRMLQPLPADRPDMAEVAAWSEGAKAETRPGLAPAQSSAAAQEQAGRRSTLGRVAAILGVLILIGSVGGTLYVFRDALPWNVAAVTPPAPAPTPPLPPASEAPVHKLPPLPEPPSHAEVAPAPATPEPGPVTPTADPAPPAPHVPKADELVQALNEAKRQKSGDLALNTPPAKPAPVEAPPKKAEPPPAKPVVAEIEPNKAEPAPAKPIVAAPEPKKAEPPPVVPPPRASQSVLTMADATVGRDYIADLPPFSDAAGGKSLVLRADPNPPDGLTFADLGSGLSQISGKPTRPGQYAFEIIAVNPAGVSAHMTTRIAVTSAPQSAEPPVVVAPTEPPPPVVAPPPSKPEVASRTPAEQAALFMRNYDGGSCFLARPLAGAGSLAIEGIGADKKTFEDFYHSFMQDVGIEPALTVRLIGDAECPAVDLIRAGSADPPHINLDGYEVGHGKPLSGTVSNLSGRRADLLLIASDGKAYRLEARPQPGGVLAFNLPITPDAASIDALQTLVAVVSTRPLRALEGFRTGSAADILPRLRSELAAGDGAVAAEFFKLVK
jgi:serine/threonine-protein kinase